MLTEVQIKAIELLVTGHSIPKTAKELEISGSTIRNWCHNNVEFNAELTKATDLFANQCLKERSRSYRAITKSITDAIIDKIDEGKLDTYEIGDLIKMLDKTVGSMNNDENAKKISTLTAIQNNIQINNNGTNEKLSDPENVKKFAQFLTVLEPDDVETVVDAAHKAEERANREK